MSVADRSNPRYVRGSRAPGRAEPAVAPQTEGEQERRLEAEAARSRRINSLLASDHESGGLVG